MKILLTTHHLANYAGSELFTYNLAKGLKKAGHQIVVYSRYIDVFAPLFEQAGIFLVSDLETLRGKSFDIAHVQHHINALEVRHVFPTLPIFFLSHSAISPLETPPTLDVNISQYGAVSDLVKQRLIADGVRTSAISLVSNIVDETLFTSSKPIHKKLKRALILSNRIDPETEQVIRIACKQLNVKLAAIGKRFRTVENGKLPAYINQADLVFTIGRGVMETAMCGRIPFILDYKGGDGMLTSINCKQLEHYHFNGTCTSKRYSVDELVKELKAYRASDAKKLQAYLQKKYSTQAVVLSLERLYKKTMKTYRHKKVNKALLAYIVESIHTTRQYTFSRSEVVAARQREVQIDVILPFHLYQHYKRIKHIVATPVKASLRIFSQA